MASLLATPRVRVLAPWRNSGEIAHRSGTVDGVPKPRRIEICANTGSYVFEKSMKWWFQGYPYQSDFKNSASGMVLEMYVTGLPKTFYVVRYFSASECNPNQNEIHCKRRVCVCKYTQVSKKPPLMWIRQDIVEKWPLFYQHLKRSNITTLGCLYSLDWTSGLTKNHFYAL